MRCGETNRYVEQQGGDAQQHLPRRDGGSCRDCPPRRGRQELPESYLPFACGHLGHRSVRVRSYC
eukprot:scaffold7358_cov252-Pinguiococcus_pyrenoidosus.AAC.19